MAIVVTPPTFRFKSPSLERPSIFLAGSIEMGNAEDWQKQFITLVSDSTSLIYNPRRPDWDNTWEQKIDHPDFNVQVNWELEMISRSDLVVFYFDPNTKSPVTMMELGLVAGLGKPAVVCCPDGFWRKGNVDIICERMGIRMVNSLAAMARVITSS